MKRTDLVNYSVGACFAAMFIGLFKPIIGDVPWYDIQMIMTYIGASITGYFAAVLINIGQGQNHQTGVSANQEEKKSYWGAVYATVAVGIVLAIVPITNYYIFLIAGAVAFVLTTIAWQWGNIVRRFKK